MKALEGSRGKVVNSRQLEGYYIELKPKREIFFDIVNSS